MSFLVYLFPSCSPGQLHLPAQPPDELLEARGSSRVAEDGHLVLLPLGHVDHRQLVRLAALLVVQVLQLRPGAGVCVLL